MEKNSYNMCNDYMNDEIDICDTLKDSDDNICISDLIFEIAENNVPIVVIPFPTMIYIETQENIQRLNGGYFIRNFLAFFILFTLVIIIKQKKWRDYYIWRDGVDGKKPNDLGSAFGRVLS